MFGGGKGLGQAPVRGGARKGEEGDGTKSEPEGFGRSKLGYGDGQRKLMSE